jgi:hypothetical protein
VSVWGTIAGSEHSRVIVADILSAAGVVLELGVGPEIECEVRGRRDVLNEYGGSNPTCPDVLVTWSGGALAIESKFTEHLGGCSQVKPQQVRTPEGKASRPPACSGNHEVGSDLRTKSRAPCRLTIKEGNRSARGYWEVAANLFQRDVLELPRRPCPFRDGHYQLMRNLCFAARLAEFERRPAAGFLLAYVKSARVAAETERAFAEFKRLLLSDVARRTGSITYEQIAGIARRHNETELADWIDGRLPAGIAGRD